MAKISGSIPNFANGVSQQAMALRLATQGDLQINGYSTVVNGLAKRPPTQRVASLGTDFIGNQFTHAINRDIFERYQVIASPYGIRVFDLTTGQEKNVNHPDGMGYLLYDTNVHSHPPYKALTVGDYTFFVNSTIKAAMDPNIVEQVSPSEAIVHVMAGNYGKDYKITINGSVVAWYRTPDGTSAAQAPAVDTSFVARRLATGETVALETTVNGQPNGNWTWKGSDTHLQANGITAANGWTVKVFKGTIYIKKDNGDNFTIGAEDGYNGHAMKAIKQQVQDFPDLPVYNEEGMALKVTGSVNTEFDDYYVRYGKLDPNDDASTPGVWKEIPEPGIETTFDPATMPHVLIREANGDFTFKRATWNTRQAGNENICPTPSFIGKTISNLVFFKNRLGFLSGENVIMSRAGDYFDFWRATATTLLDDDPIDVAAAERGVSILRHGEGYEDRLLLFADQKQFVLRGNELLTPKTVSIVPSTGYQCDPKCQPVSSGNSVFFSASRGQYSMVREFKVMDTSGKADAPDITGHVPQYIPGSIDRMAASSHEDILICRSTSQEDEVYVYKFYWSGEQKLLSSWSKWTFPGVTKVLDFTFIQSRLYLLLLRDNETTLEFMDVQPGGSDDYSDFIVHLDRRFSVTPAETYGVSEDEAYNAFDDTTYVEMSIDVSNLDVTCVTGGSPDPTHTPGLEVDILEKGVNYVLLRGDLRNKPVYFGLDYEMRYRMSTIYIRQESRGGGITTITEGRLQLLQFILQYASTGYFRIEVTPKGRPMRSYSHNGRIVGDIDNVLDKVVIGDGSYRIPVLSRNERVTIEFVNDSYLPSSLISAEWIGNYVRKSQRI